MSKLFHVLESQQFDRELIDQLCRLALHIKKMHSMREGALKLRNLYPNKRAMLYFAQPSARTFLSFVSACQNLGMNWVEIRDPRVSSEAKGESPLDSIRTFASYVDVIIMRSPRSGFAKQAAEHLDQTPRPVPIINAGSGPDQHPTQALLDAYTLQRSFRGLGGIDGKVIAMVGDLKRGRTVRSLSYLMKHYKDVRLIFVSPPEFRMEKDILDFLHRHEIPFVETEDFDQAVAEADAVYMTRIQDEHDQKRGESAGVDINRFCFQKRHLNILKAWGVVMHPLPRRKELDPSCDRDPRVKIWRQERNGMWIRTALLHTILKEKNPLERID